MNRNGFLLLCMAGALTTACHSSKTATPATNASAPTQIAASQPVYKPGSPPSDTQLREAITRNYENAVTIDSSRSVPFVVGDFNWDGSEDIAIVVKPATEKLPELNSEYVNWILEDPHKVRPQERKTPLSIGQRDLLLAVIHGQEREGWRSPSARQTYLLKNAVGVELQTETATHLSGSRSLPPLKGDVIRERLDGAGGIIYWTGARYSWHSMAGS